jgi:hypothetical protein
MTLYIKVCLRQLLLPPASNIHTCREVCGFDLVKPGFRHRAWSGAICIIVYYISLKGLTACVRVDHWKTWD